jgi:GNAT superfamily N-acetyltransferase
MHDIPLPVNIRQATVVDARSITEIRVRGWQWAYRGLLPDAYLDGLSDTLEARVEDLRARLARGVPLSRWWVIEQAERVIGFALTGPSNDPDAHPLTAMVYAFYLTPEMVSKGFGRALFAHAISDLQQRGYMQAAVWVLEGNVHARRFYEAAGWTPDGTRKTEEILGALSHEVRYHIILRGDGQ